MNSQAAKLRELLATGRIFVTPCCGDALTAKLIQQAGFELTFLSGFGVAASRLALPDTGLISFGEILDQARNIRSAVDIPILVDGDTGYGNALNVRRTVQEYAKLEMASVMIEDQVHPKRCGHTRGKQVVDFPTACQRIRAAVDSRNEQGDILIMGRTDCLQSQGLGEAIKRANAFRQIGADITFVEAPQSVEQLKQIGGEVEGPKMANMLEGGLTPILPPSELAELGFSIASYPFTLLMSSIGAMQSALRQLKQGHIPPARMSFDELKSIIGFDDYYREEQRYI